MLLENKVGCRNSQGEGKSLNLIFLDFFDSSRCWKISYHEGVVFLFFDDRLLNKWKKSEHIAHHPIFFWYLIEVLHLYFFLQVLDENSLRRMHFSEKKILIWEGEKLLTKMPQAMPNIRILIFFKIFQTWKRLLINPYIHHLRFGRVSYHSVIPEGVTKSVKKFLIWWGGWNKNKKGENKILTIK